MRKKLMEKRAKTAVPFGPGPVMYPNTRSPDFSLKICDIFKKKFSSNITTR